MEANKIDYMHTICIDNALVLGLDPTFMGMVVSQGAEVGSLVVPKRDWEEKIGMLVKKDGQFSLFFKLYISRCNIKKMDKIQMPPRTNTMQSKKIKKKPNA